MADSRRSMFYEFARYGQVLRKPTTLITNPFTRDPRVVMEELREADPDGHALLSEHIVLPERDE